jgi:winged helix-turn helix protein
LRVRTDFTAGEVRRFARRAKDAAQARRLLAIAAVLDGGSREDAAKIGGMDRQTLRDWVIRFNEQGPNGLINIPSPGVPPKLGKKLIHRHPVLKVAVKPVGLLDQHHPARWVPLQIADHLAEDGAAGLLGRLHVHIFLRHREVVGGGMFLEELELCRNREAFLLLLEETQA